MTMYVTPPVLIFACDAPASDIEIDIDGEDNLYLPGGG